MVSHVDEIVLHSNTGWGIDLEGDFNEVFDSNDMHFDMNALGDIIVRDDSVGNDFYNLDLNSDSGVSNL